MTLDDLDLRELLSFEPSGGVIRFGGERAVILDAVALGLMRKELIDTIGWNGARGVLARFGYAHGWRTAESLKTSFPWDSEREWRRAGGRLHRLQGQVLVEPVSRPQGGEDGDRDIPGPFAENIWRDSYEAEQHLLHLGRADEPVCWTLTGFASGYLSYCNGREIFCLEDRCVGRGDAVCHVVGRPAEEWDRVNHPFPWCRKESLDAALQRLTEALMATEQKLRRRQKQMARDAGVADDGSDLVAGLVARSPSMKLALDLARRVARVDSSVLVTGESGVGKERVARLIHEESARSSGPFVAVNCGAVAEGLLESELFGHARGAFTGATQDRPGLFEAAQGGTLFLDEVGEISPGMQVKLLRALQEREVRRVGENHNRRVDVRLLAATNRDLAREVSAGRFRQDLYYRLRVIELRVPPLRERKEDILPLSRVLLRETVRRTGCQVSGFSPRAADQLLRYDWPGNVRELENAVERAVVLAGGSHIESEDLPEEVRAALSVAYTPGRVHSLSEVERDYILAVLQANGGNQARTAEQLQIGTATLYRKLRQYKEEQGQA